MEITVLDWLDRTADRLPDKTAFIDESGSLTFAELRQSARQIGSQLLKYNKDRQPIVVMSGRHRLTPACFLGVVFSGNFYAPVDGTMPIARLSQILDVIQSDLLIVDRENLEVAKKLRFRGTILVLEDMMRGLAEDMQIDPSVDVAGLERVRRGMSSDMPLYTIFTSGSTGVPKGVITSHYALMCYIEAVSEVLDIGEGDRLGNQSPLDYIAAIRDIYFPVKEGASTVILPKQYFAVPARLFEALNQYQVTTLCWSTSALAIPAQMKAFEYEVPKFLKKVCFSGSVIPGRILKIWQENLPNVMFVNQYGPTEATASCTYYVVKEPVTEDTVLPIGRPYRQYRILLLDEQNQETLPGEIGEICILGPALALGYYGTPDRSAQAFMQNPLNHAYRELIYKTGDLGRFREDGELEFHGRKDRQVKHLGHRVELSELERAAEEIEGVTESCALYDKEKENLYLFYTGEAQKKQIFIEMREKLPGFMVPRKIINLTEIPRLANGKTDMVTLKNYFS